MGKGSIASEWALEDGRWPESQFDCRVFFSDSPLKNMIDGNLVFPRPPDDIINKRAYPTLDLLWVRFLLHWNGRWMMGGYAESYLIVVHLFYSPLKNMIGQKIVFPHSPDDII